MAKEDDIYRVGYACGLYCKGTCDTFLFVISIFAIGYDFGYDDTLSRSPEIVWSANRNNSVGKNASLEVTNGGDLLLRDADGTFVWSTNTSGKAFAGLNLTEMGNLVLFDANNSVIWQSFDHPTDCLLLGQTLGSGMNLKAAASPTNRSEGLYSLSMGDRGLEASIISHPPQVYFKISYSDGSKVSYAAFQNGILGFYPDEIRLAYSTKTRYMKLEHDGHLRVYEWSGSWSEVADILTGDCVNVFILWFVVNMRFAQMGNVVALVRALGRQTTGFLIKVFLRSFHLLVMLQTSIVS